MTAKAIILINPLGGICEFREYAKSNGLTVVSIYTPDKDALSRRMGQDIDKLVKADCHSIFSADVGEILGYLSQLPLDFKAVVPCHECGVEVGAQVAAGLRLKHNGVDSMFAARDKRLMRERVRDSGLRSPHFSVVESIAEIDRFVAEHPFPLVIKTPLGGGTSNVYVCRDRQAVLEGYEKIKTTPDLFGNCSDSAVLEDYLDGKEIIVDGFSDGKTVTFVGVWEYHKISNQHGDNLYYNIVAKDLSDPAYSHALDYTRRLVEVIGIELGMFHCELKLNDDIPTLVEIGARLPGWGIPELYRAASNFDPWEKTLEVFTQGELSQRLNIQYHKVMAMAICPVTDSGVVDEICGLEEIKALPSFETMALKIAEGDIICPTKELYDTPLEVCLSHKDEAQLLQDLTRVHELFRLSVRPVL